MVRGGGRHGSNRGWGYMKHLNKLLFFAKQFPSHGILSPTTLKTKRRHTNNKQELKKARRFSGDFY